MTADFYKDSEIFFTGGSGVIGKAAIEKLLRSCDVKYIYVLLRNKKGKGIEDRIKELKNSRIFKRLKECKPNELNKLIAISGDTTLDGLGISPEQRLMIENVSVFIHSAATTRFAEPLRMAITYNLKSTLEALKLAETLPKLKLFLHVSTFFCNPFVKHIEDKMYPGVFDWRSALKLLDPSYEHSGAVLEAISNKVIEGFPNTYVFTKHLSEQLVNDYRSKLPVALFRPSIVVAAIEEPEPGFTESMVGVMGMFAVWGTGFMQTILCRKQSVLDFTPLDLSTKFMLMFAAKTAQLEKEKIQETTPIGMFSSHGICFHNFGQIADMVTSSVREYPYEKSLWIPHISLTACPFLYMIYSFIFQIFPAIVLDLVLRLVGKKPRIMEIQRKIFFTAQALYYFLTTEYTSDGPTHFNEFMETGKGTEFDVSITKSCCSGDKNMKGVLGLNVQGARKFLLNEDESSLPSCRRLFKGKLIAYYMLKIVVACMVGYAIFRRVINYLME